MTQFCMQHKGLTVQLIYTPRKKLRVTVERDRSVVVRAPIGTTEARIRSILDQKASWIYCKRNHPRKSEAPKQVRLRPGSALLYIGRPLRLDVSLEPFTGLRLAGHFQISSENLQRANEIVADWYQSKATEIIRQRIHHFSGRIGVAPLGVSVRELRASWASCSTKGRLCFDWRLLRAPLFVIDYVVVHELAHLREQHHGKDFWRLVRSQMPTYRRAQDWLAEKGSALR